MIFSVILLLLLLGIAYFHYAQGFFGATISAVIAVFAAILAVGYHENVVVSLLGGKMADYAHAMTLCAIFAGVYITGRVITDSAIPGNMRLPVMVDRIGGALMGLVAGVFTTGVLALAAQALPFGPSIAGYTRLELEDDREVQVTPFDARGDRAIDVAITDQVKENGFTEASRQSLWIPVDDLLLATVQKLSDNGSMAGARTLYSVHPNYADELFGQRLGIQLGAQRTALNVGGKTQVRLADPGLFVVPQDLTKNQVDAELDTMHTTAVNWKKKGNEAQLIVRLMFAPEAADKKDSTVRVSPGAIRLVANGVNYHPVGTYEGGRLYSNKLDDFLFIGGGSGADFVFFVDPTDVFAGGASSVDPKSAKEPAKVKDGVFVEVKRLAHVDLSGKPVSIGGVTRSEEVQVERKKQLAEQRKIGATPASDPPAAGGDAPAAPAATGDETKKNPMQVIREGTKERNEQIQK